MVEQFPLKELVGGSNPLGLTAREFEEFGVLKFEISLTNGSKLGVPLTSSS